MKVRKRNGNIVDYDCQKIICAIKKANQDVKFEDDRASDDDISTIIYNIEKTGFDTLSVEEIQDKIEQNLVKINKYELAKAYILYRY